MTALETVFKIHSALARPAIKALTERLVHRIETLLEESNGNLNQVELQTELEEDEGIWGIEDESAWERKKLIAECIVGVQKWWRETRNHAKLNQCIDAAIAEANMKVNFQE